MITFIKFEQKENAYSEIKFVSGGIEILINDEQYANEHFSIFKIV
jgi:hypothetical protein